MKERGITLIALVITIIVLLILAGVSIAMLTGDNGILTQATRARTETEKAEAEEQVKTAVWASYNNSGKLDYTELKDNLNKIPKISGVPDEITEKSFPLTVNVNGYDVTIENNGTVKTESGSDEDEDPLAPEVTLTEENIGATINYKPNGEDYTAKAENTGLSKISAEETDEEMSAKKDQDQTITPENVGWKIWSVDDTTLKLISDVPTTQELSLYGAEGYNNGVFLLNEICKANYINSQYEGIKVRNLNELDITEKVTNYTPNYYVQSTTKNIEFPNIYIQQDMLDTDETSGSRHMQTDLVHGTTNEEHQINKSVGGLQLEESEFVDPSYYDMLSDESWLSSRLAASMRGSTSRWVRYEVDQFIEQMGRGPWL